MPADKATETTGLEDQFAVRRDHFQKNISDSKKQFIQNQAQLGLLNFLVEARNQLDALEARMLAQLGKKRSSLFSFFSNSKTVVPAGAVDELSGEFETARRLLLEINEYILFDMDETNLALLAFRQHEHFEANIKGLKAGGRVERYWNDTQEENLVSEEVEERKLLGKISQPKIFSILNEVREELDVFPIRVKYFLKQTNDRVSDDVEKQVDIVFKEFATTPVGKYVTSLIDLKSKTDSLLAKGKPQSVVDKMLNKLILTTQAAKDALSKDDLKNADIHVIEKFELTKVDILLLTLPNEKYNDLIHRISKSIHMQDKSVEPQPTVNSHYRRSSNKP